LAIIYDLADAKFALSLSVALDVEAVCATESRVTLPPSSILIWSTPPSKDFVEAARQAPPPLLSIYNRHGELPPPPFNLHQAIGVEMGAQPQAASIEAIRQAFEKLQSGSRLEPIDCFISYARPETLQARFLAEQLSLLGVRTWYDKELTLGAEFPQEIEDRARRAKAILSLCTRHSAKRPWVLAEQNIGREQGKLIALDLRHPEDPEELVT